jgi:spermidine synthase
MTSRRFLPALLLLFIGSGCAALIYEIVWFQLLQLVIGSSAISLGVLLGTFMGGMCLGSFVLSSVVPARHHPLRVYAGLELGIALIGLLVLVGMPLVSGVYTSWAGSGVAGLLFRGVIASVCLLPPTLLMGATLPAISRWVEATPEGVSWLGFFYGGNIAGAVAGSVLTGFYLLRVFDVSVARTSRLPSTSSLRSSGWRLPRRRRTKRSNPLRRASSAPPTRRVSTSSLRCRG